MSAPTVVHGLVISAPAHQVHPASHDNLVVPSRGSSDPLFCAQPIQGIPPAHAGAPLGLNLTCSAPDASVPIHGAPSGKDGQNSILTSLVYRVDRIANPDTSTKPGTLENIRRNEEILVYVARFFDNNTVALCPGAHGNSLAVGLKSLNEKLRPLYDQYRISGGFSNRFCIAAACMYWGGTRQRRGVLSY